MKLKKIWKTVSKYFFLELGAILAATGLELFLIPNNIIDGGINGISIILSYLTGIPLGLYIFFLNIPFLFIGYKQIGKTFVVSTFFAITSLAIWVTLLTPVPGFTQDVLLASVFGGIVLGIGIGMIIRYGGSLDGTEIVAIILDRRSGFSVGEIVMFFNIFILSSAGFVFGWDRAMYSLITYFIAFRIIDTSIKGLDEEKAAIIVSTEGEEIAEAIMARLGRGVTYLEGKGAYSGDQRIVLYSVITRLEVAKLKSIVMEKDPDAFVTINAVSDIMGGNRRKRAIH